MEADTRNSSGLATQTADHLCVLVHGLWGNPTHLKYLASALRERYDESQLVVLVCKRNAGNFTYDGVEVGAERVAKEIEETLEQLFRDDFKITKMSIVGYSLGGLVARYAIGLLHHRGWFNKIRPVNFTTFASPHLGVRTPLIGFHNNMWNVLGANLLSKSGRQLFIVDSFRDTGRPLLSVLADPDSIFIRALASFKHRSLYANIVNDRSAVYYTTAISRIDPFTNLEKLDLKHVPGYEPVILDPEEPYILRENQGLPSFYVRLAGGSNTFFRRLPLFMALVVIVPIATTAFLFNAAIQTIRSRQRILLHETNYEGHGFSGYRFPFIIQDMRHAVEDAFENVNTAQCQENLPQGSEELAHGHSGVKRDSAEPQLPNAGESALLEKEPAGGSAARRPHQERKPQFPTLALTPSQFEMIQTLDDVGFRKYLVHIQKSSHSHAAIIVRPRRLKGAFEEGHMVIDHFLKDFEI